jgi:hypothetical protein
LQPENTKTVIERNPANLVVKTFFWLDWGFGYWYLGGYNYKAFEVDFVLDAEKFVFKPKCIASEKKRGSALS